MYTTGSDLYVFIWDRFTFIYVCVWDRFTVTAIQQSHYIEMRAKRTLYSGFNPMWICAAAAAQTHCLKFVQTSFHCSSTPFTLSLRLSFSSFPIASSLFPAYSSWPNHGRLLVDWWTHAATVLNTSFRMHRRYLCAQLHSAFFTHVCECHILFP